MPDSKEAISCIPTVLARFPGTAVPSAARQLTLEAGVTGVHRLFAQTAPQSDQSPGVPISQRPTRILVILIADRV
ncbi:hypothetical protein PG996_011195 [Apiospora saccharicola]|uniref:Uncharacterized protein n=1 Tax=Apiospora saccharicola TaxID=335842 RepID=A0ABR1UH52_9PEZI